MTAALIVTGVLAQLGAAAGPAGADTLASCTSGTTTTYCQDFGAGTVNAGAVGYGFAFGVTVVLILAAWTLGWGVIRFMARP